MVRTILAAAGLLAIGCAGLQVDPAEVVPAPAGADQAIAGIAALYGMASPPAVYFYRIGPCGGFIRNDTGECVDGATADDGSLVIVRRLPDGPGVLSDPTTHPGDASVAHEMAHAANLKRGGDGDPGHRGHFFSPGGEVAQASALLVSLGM